MVEEAEQLSKDTERWLEELNELDDPNRHLPSSLRGSNISGRTTPASSQYDEHQQRYLSPTTSDYGSPSVAAMINNEDFREKVRRFAQTNAHPYSKGRLNWSQQERVKRTGVLPVSPVPPEQMPRTLVNHLAQSNSEQARLDAVRSSRYRNPEPSKHKPDYNGGCINEPEGSASSSAYSSYSSVTGATKPLATVVGTLAPPAPSTVVGGHSNRLSSGSTSTIIVNPHKQSQVPVPSTSYQQQPPIETRPNSRFQISETPPPLPPKNTKEFFQDIFDKFDEEYQTLSRSDSSPPRRIPVVAKSNHSSSGHHRSGSSSHHHKGTQPQVIAVPPHVPHKPPQLVLSPGHQKTNHRTAPPVYPGRSTITSPVEPVSKVFVEYDNDQLVYRRKPGSATTTTTAVMDMPQDLSYTPPTTLPPSVPALPPSYDMHRWTNDRTRLVETGHYRVPKSLTNGRSMYQQPVEVPQVPFFSHNSQQPVLHPSTSSATSHSGTYDNYVVANRNGIYAGVPVGTNGPITVKHAKTSSSGTGSSNYDSFGTINSTNSSSAPYACSTPPSTLVPQFKLGNVVGRSVVVDRIPLDEMHIETPHTPQRPHRAPSRADGTFSPTTWNRIAVVPDTVSTVPSVMGLQMPPVVSTTVIPDSRSRPTTRPSDLIVNGSMLNHRRIGASNHRTTSDHHQPGLRMHGRTRSSPGLTDSEISNEVVDHYRAPDIQTSSAGPLSPPPSSSHTAQWNKFQHSGRHLNMYGTPTSYVGGGQVPPPSYTTARGNGVFSPTPPSKSFQPNRLDNLTRALKSHADDNASHVIDRNLVLSNQSTTRPPNSTGYADVPNEHRNSNEVTTTLTNENVVRGRPINRRPISSGGGIMSENVVVGDAQFVSSKRFPSADHIGSMRQQPGFTSPLSHDRMTFGICQKCGDNVNDASEACQALGKLYHAHCFACCSCGKPLRGKAFYNVAGKIYCEDDYMFSGFQQSEEKCGVCGQAIMDMILQAVGTSFHPACFRCCVCNVCLEGVPFTVDQQKRVYCVNDYHRMFAPRCAACQQPITPVAGTDETVRVVSMNRDYHVDCYVCQGCGLQLTDEPERRCYPLEGKLLCQRCHVLWARTGGARQVTTDL